MAYSRLGPNGEIPEDAREGNFILVSRIFRHDDESHNIPLGTLVRIELDEYVDEENPGFKGTFTGFVISHDRDCDGTPLYSIAYSPIGYPENSKDKPIHLHFVRHIFNGYPEKSIEVVNDSLSDKFQTFEEFRREVLGFIER